MSATLDFLTERKPADSFDTKFVDTGFGSRFDDKDNGFGDAAVFGDVLASDTVVRSYLRPIKRHMLEHKATEIWINKPGELIIQLETGNLTVEEPALDFAALEAFAQAIAVYSPQQQTVGARSPLLSATMPDGERIQIVLPPAVEPGMVSMSIRIPNSEVFPLKRYQDSGAFSKFIWPRPNDLEVALFALSPDDRHLAELLAAGNLHDFLIASIMAKKNTGVIGDTGSGKTTLMKSMCQHIPLHERLITVEDVRELMLPMHQNRVHLLYSKSSQGVARVTPADLIGSLMRMAPDRALLAELRSSEAWDFLKLLTTGHSGSITSWHAESCALGSERFVFMCKENSEAATLGREEIKHLYTLTIDVVIHIARKIVYDPQGKQIGYERYVDEVYFDPWAKAEARFGGQQVQVEQGG
ncbi:type IV secretion system protein VirB11 [Rhodoferax ferrireducens]|uniref:Type IV secretion system protein n=1 Tax=Rhodoferax ferrireducens TaxID=192843 RepID=A0ABU2CGG4_9BURK|nr:P-type DNA transfer ATPase VirB11 [Rhodoferax ferrireducens]MDR7380425.1 type IV secretion system protein VirB11 [Rhodoferax ferrireducens]